MIDSTSSENHHFQLDWSVYVSACVVYESDTQDAPFQMTYVDAMQRRRLSRLAKISLGVMYECIKNSQKFQIVYASRHGELDRTTELLNQIAVGDDVSPMGFSLAVLNSTAGVFSIATANHAPSSAVSAGVNTFEMGLLEASMQATQSNVPVLFAYADEPISTIYGATEEGQTTPMHAVAMLLHGAPAEDRSKVNLSVSTSRDQTIDIACASIAFARAWKARSHGRLASGGREFAWSYR